MSVAVPPFGPPAAAAAHETAARRPAGPLARDLLALFAAQQKAFAAQSFPTAAARLDRLERLRRILLDHEDSLADAISADFGHRSRHETVIAEVFFVLAGIAHARSHLGRWMKQRRVATSFHSLPGSSSILPQPLGRGGHREPVELPAATGARAGRRGHCSGQPA